MQCIALKTTLGNSLSDLQWWTKDIVDYLDMLICSVRHNILAVVFLFSLAESPSRSSRVRDIWDKSRFFHQTVHTINPYVVFQVQCLVILHPRYTMAGSREPPSEHRTKNSTIPPLNSSTHWNFGPKSKKLQVHYSKLHFRRNNKRNLC